MKKFISIILSGLLFTTQAIAGAGMGPGPGLGSFESGGLIYNQVFFDDFVRADSETIGGSWTSEIDTAFQLDILNNMMVWSGANNTPGYVEKILGSYYYKYRVEFDFKINTVTTDAVTRSMQLCSARQTSNHGITFGVSATSASTLNAFFVQYWKEDLTSTTESAAYSISPDTSYRLRIDVSTASSSSANDGTIEFFINGSRILNLTGLDTYGRQTNVLRSGMIYTSWVTAKTVSISNFYFGSAD